MLALGREGRAEADLRDDDNDGGVDASKGDEGGEKEERAAEAEWYT
jgi:hypothetical protein